MAYTNAAQLGLLTPITEMTHTVNSNRNIAMYDRASMIECINKLKHIVKNSDIEGFCLTSDPEFQHRHDWHSLHRAVVHSVPTGRHTVKLEFTYSNLRREPRKLKMIKR